MTALTETRKLTLHPLAIHTFIKAQAGSLGKALSEAVMNSLDAFASSVTITVDTHGYVIEDDGQGFVDRSEIFAWFETLGFPHDEGNHRTYGKFGLGRAQQWAYASTVWYSNQFVMHVDVQQNGLDYRLEEVPDRTQGTRIEGRFYQPLSFPALTRLEQELTDLVRYAPGVIIVNGKVVNKDPASEDWDLETEDAYMRFDAKAHALAVYNGGILVNHFQRYRFNCTGVVVTKPNATLSLNVARNDILEAECKVWARIRKNFPRSLSTKNKARKPRQRLSSDEAALVIAETKAGKRQLPDVLAKAPYLVTTVHGRGVGWRDLTSLRYPRVVFAPKGDNLGKRVSKLREALVISKETLELWNLSAHEFKELVLRDADVYHRNYLERRPWAEDVATLFPELLENKVTLAVSELEPAEKAALAAIGSTARHLLNLLQPHLADAGIRHVSGVDFGDAPARVAWFTDTGRLVLRKDDAVKAATGNLPSLQAHMLKCLREALKDKLGVDKADSLLVDLISGTPALGRFALAASARYVRECKGLGLPVPEVRLSELESVAAV